MPLLDFDSLVICNNDRKPESICATLRHFNSLGIKKFILTYGVDPHSSSNFTMLNSFNEFKENIFSVRPRGIKLRVVPEVYLHASVLRNPLMRKFKVTKAKLLFVRAPIFNDEDWLPQDISFLLYKQHIKPVMCSFESNLDTCDKRTMDQLYKTQNVIHSMDINYLTSVSSDDHLRMLTKHEIPILPCISKDLCYYTDALVRYRHLRERIGDVRYLKFCKHLNQSARSVFDFI